MATPAFRCGEHGYHETEICPVCGEPGRRVLAGDRRERLSRFVSGALRHFPDDAGIALDPAGWTDRGALADAVTDRYDWARPAHLDAVLATDPKGRFEHEAGRVRAAYGHSVDVDLGVTDDPIPDVLYHGTAPRNLDSIREEGLRPMGRREVHLSGTVEAAREVGARHAEDPVVLVVDAAGLLAAGHDVEKRGRETYTTGRVPSRYLSTDRDGASLFE